MKDKESGIYAYCESCENPIYEHMDDNKKIFDETKMCGACCFGEVDIYTDELSKDPLKGLKKSL